MARTSRASDQVLLRLPDGLRDRVKEAADAAGRSTNAEIVRVLLEAFPDPASRTLSLNQVIDLTETYENAVGPDYDRIPTSEILRILYRVEIGDTEGLDEIVVRALREKLDQFRDAR